MFKKLVFTLILAFYLTEFNAQKLVPNIPLETFKGTYTTMNKELSETKFSAPYNMIVSNVTAEPSNDPEYKLSSLLSFIS